MTTRLEAMSANVHLDSRARTVKLKSPSHVCPTHVKTVDAASLSLVHPEASFVFAGRDGLEDTVIKLFLVPACPTPARTVACVRRLLLTVASPTTTVSVASANQAGWANTVKWRSLGHAVPIHVRMMASASARAMASGTASVSLTGVESTVK